MEFKVHTLHATPLKATSLAKGSRERQIVKASPVVIRGVETKFNLEKGSINARRTEILKDTSKLPQCSTQQKEYYEKNWERILNPRMQKHLRSSKDVLHGGRSLNMLLANDNPQDPLYRESKDWDIFSKRDLIHAKKLEKQIDSNVGCNICDIVHVPIPKMWGSKEYEGMSADLYRLTTSTKKDADVDIMSYPKKLCTIRNKSIYHECLESQHEKARRGLMRPIRMMKSSIDKNRIEKYWRAHGMSW